TMVENSGNSVDWLVDNFGLDLSLLARLGGHSAERTHRGKERFPGMTITYAQIQKAEAISKALPERCQIVNKARVTDLIMDDEGAVIGVHYEKAGKGYSLFGPVILATGGFGADFSKDGLLAKYRPDLLKLATTNGEHCTGDGIKMGVAAGADTVDLEWVQVHPTGLVNPKDPDCKVKFLAAEALRGVGGLLLDADGKRFSNELGRRDYVSNRMFANKGPFRLVLNSAAANDIHWHVEHYEGRGVMRHFKSGSDLAKEMGIAPSTLEETFKSYIEVANKQTADPNNGPYDAYPSGKTWDSWGKKFFKNYEYKMDDEFDVAIVTPLVHYCMGGLKIDTTGHVLDKEGKPIRGLYAAGELMGGVHGNNRLGGNSLLDCVVFGRLTGKDLVKTCLKGCKPVSLADLAEGRTGVSKRAIVVGGGLAGFSAANTVLEHGGEVLLLDKSAFCGGNSSKATSGINGCCTRTQQNLGVKDSVELFESDCMKGGSKSPELIKTMVENSGNSVDWLVDNFDLDLSLLARLGGHSAERTHRGKERFPGMTITYAQIQMAEAISKAHPDKCQIINKARVNDLITEDGEVVGVEYTTKDGQTHKAYGPVILATGGFGADFSNDGLLAKYRPDLLKLSTTNGEHCTGDGIKMGVAVGADTVDLEWVQVHPTGLVNPKDPDCKVKFLAAEALRGVGGLLLDADGKRFSNELGRRDYVSNRMFANKGPFRLVLNSAAANDIHWHVEHYEGRGVMRHFKSGSDLAKEMGIAPSTLEETFKSYIEVANKQTADPNNGPYDAYPSGKTWDSWGKKFFKNYEYKMDDEFDVAIVTPLVHYCMGGLKIDTTGRVLDKEGKPIRGLYAAGELMGGVHGNNRLGGNSLLDCVVFGRLTGKDLCENVLDLDNKLNLKNLKTAPAKTAPVARKAAPAPAPVAAPAPVSNGYTMEEVAKHNTDTDCWVVLNGEVLDVTDFLPEHPGGKLAIMTFAGKDATKEFNMIHPADVVEKYVPESVLGPVVEASAAPAAPVAAAAAAPAAPTNGYTLEEVAKHNTDTDCWVALNGQVLDVTDFLPEHPGGKLAIMTFAGKDASKEFNMIHPADVVEKYVPESILGPVVEASAAAAAPVAAPAAAAPANGITMEEVAKHTSETDCWVVVNGQVLDVTDFLPEHPGGKLAIMTFAGKDASKEFNMIHPADVVEKYASDAILGPVVEASAVAPAGASNNLAQPLLSDYSAKAAPAQWWGEERNTCDMHGPLGPSVWSYCAALCYFVWMFVLETLKTIFTVKNWKNISDKSGLTRSAIFMMVFVTIHALGNIHLFFGAIHFNAYAYFLNHPCPWSTLLLPVEIYLLAAGLLHVTVATVRTFKFKSMNSSIDQLWLFLTGSVLFVFLVVHLMQFRFVSEAAAPQYYFRSKWMYPFYCSSDDTSCQLVHFKDLYKMEMKYFESFGWVLFYEAGVIAFWSHMKEGIRKVIAAYAGIPRKYKSQAQFFGQLMAWVLGLLYFSYPLFSYFAPIRDWAKYDAAMPTPVEM
ncbi:hypothetical protein FOZ62_030072, partial [Perkinsus olseni]